MLPSDLAGKINELEHYDFQSSESRQRFESLLEKPFRQQIMQQMLDQMSGEGRKNDS
ncbi:hypothetical protein EMGBS4_20020 [Acidimicrobiaceae bacterium]|nr:hypothetical protein EMGBS4_20020 [Acidimicrobiaceae bacterium]